MTHVDCKLFRRVLIRQHKAQMKRKSKEIQEALVRNDCMCVTIGPQCVYVRDIGPITLLRSVDRPQSSSYNMWHSIRREVLLSGRHAV